MPQTMKSLKTPLRYPGGKSRALSKLFQYIPDLKDYKEYREPFLGGGSVALRLLNVILVWISRSTIFTNLFITSGENCRTTAMKLRTYSSNLNKGTVTILPQRNSFWNLKDYLSGSQTTVQFPPYTEDIWRAVSFYVVNKCSFSGLTESSSFSKQASDQNFSLAGIERLRDYSKLIGNWTITNKSYEYLLSDEKSVFTYLDPPYEIGSNLYGKRGNMHSGFNHDHFAIKCDRFIGPQLISYNSSQLIRERFKGWQAAEFAHTYTMRSVGTYNTDQADRKELVLANYEMRS